MKNDDGRDDAEAVAVWRHCRTLISS